MGLVQLYYYVWDAHFKVVYRFISAYQRKLWLGSRNPEFAHETAPVAFHDKRVQAVNNRGTWTANIAGFEVGTAENIEA